jgi:hypothetical protein
MPRLRNVQSGAVVSCTAETAARLGSEWSEVEDKKSTEKAPAKRAVKKSDEK